MNALNDVLNRIKTSLEEGAMAYIKQKAEWDNVHPVQAEFFKWQYKNAEKVKVVSYKTLPIAHEIDVLFPEGSIAFKECYKTASTATTFLKNVEFVAGEVSFAGIPITHAWNCYKGKYFDLQKEIGLSGKTDFDEYVKIIKIDKITLKKYLSKASNVCSSFIGMHYAVENNIKVPKHFYFEAVKDNLSKILTVLDEERNLKQLEKVTKKSTKDKSEEVKVRLVTKTKKGKYVYETFTPSSGKKYKQFIKPVPPNTSIGSLDDNVIVHCTCPNFKYVHEVSLWMTNASHVISSNGAEPVITNKGLRKTVCKHLIAVMKDLKDRI